MGITIYSVFMAVLWFSLFVLLGSILRRATGFLIVYSLWPLVIVFAICLLRIVAPIEFPFTEEILSETIYPAIQSVWKTEFTLKSGLTVSLLNIIVTVSCIVSLVLLVILIWKGSLVKNYIKGLTSVDDDLARMMLDDVMAETNYHGSCKLIVSPYVRIPSMTGFIRPVMMLPSEIVYYSEDTLKYIIEHEWYHFRHKDLWVRFFINVLCCIMWWNPLIYLLRHEVNQTFELRSDFRVTRGLTREEQTAYFERIQQMLIDESERLKANHDDDYTVGLLGSDTVSEMIQRIEVAMEYRGKSHVFSHFLFYGVMLVLLFLSYCFILQPYGDVPLDEDDYWDYAIIFTPENSYLILEDNGQYSQYYNDEYFSSVSEEDLQYPPISDLPIRDNKKGE